MSMFDAHNPGDSNYNRLIWHELYHALELAPKARGKVDPAGYRIDPLNFGTTSPSDFTGAARENAAAHEKRAVRFANIVATQPPNNSKVIETTYGGRRYDLNTGKPNPHFIEVPDPLGTPPR